MAIQTTDHSIKIDGLKEDIQLMGRQINAINLYTGDAIVELGNEPISAEEAWETIWSPEFDKMVPPGTINKKAFLLNKISDAYLQLYVLEAEEMEDDELVDELDFMESYKLAVVDSLSDEVSDERWKESLEIICRSEEIFPDLSLDRKRYLEEKIKIVKSEIKSRSDNR